MKLVGITAYGINVRNEEHQNIELHDIYGGSLLQYLEQITNGLVDEYDKDTAQENVFAYNIVEFDTIRNDEGQGIYDILYLRIKTGEYGEESEIIDSGTGNVTHRKGVEEADVMPFGCCVIVPCGRYTEGIVLVQSLGRNGIASLIKKKFNDYIRALDSQLRVVLNPIIPRQYMNRLLNDGVLKAVRLVSYGISDDDADRYGLDRGVNRIVQERVFRSPVGFLRNRYDRIIQCINGEITYDAIVELDDFEIDDLKLEFSFGKRNKTISMRGLDRLSVNEDVTEDVEIINGHPTFESLCEVMRDIGEEYLRARWAID